MTVPILTLSVVAVLAVGALPPAGASPLAPGQDPDRRKLFVDVHFEDREWTRLTVESTTYDFTIDLAKPSVTRFANRCAGATQDLLDGDFLLLAARSEGKDYVSTNAPDIGRLNIWRQGQYYYEVHVRDIGLRDALGAQLPVAGEMVFYCYPDKLHIEGKLIGGAASLHRLRPRDHPWRSRDLGRRHCQTGTSRPGDHIGGGRHGASQVGSVR